MKKSILLLLFSLLALSYSQAKLNGSGYYRIWNSKIEAVKKHKAFVCVTYNRYNINTAGGTMQNVDAVPLYFTDKAKN
ncbi:MAG: hypothetical protein Q4D28_06085, partial [Prevotellaceae bacterium]|nr:hypothetical protein [Prevotellaceae bacterium]